MRGLLCLLLLCGCAAPVMPPPVPGAADADAPLVVPHMPETLDLNRAEPVSPHARAAPPLRPGLEPEHHPDHSPDHHQPDLHKAPHHGGD